MNRKDVDWDCQPVTLFIGKGSFNKPWSINIAFFLQIENAVLIIDQYGSS
jgi:hypothetical protein